MSEIAKKARLLTGYLEARIIRRYGYNNPFYSTHAPEFTAQCERTANGKQNGAGDAENQSGPVTVEILTPSDPSQRGAQLSLSFSVNIMEVFEELRKRGVVVSIKTESDIENLS